MPLAAIPARIARIQAPLSGKLGAAFLVMAGALLATGVVSILVVARIQSQVSELARLDVTVGLARTLDYSIVAQEHFSSMFVLTG